MRSTVTMTVMEFLTTKITVHTLIIQVKMILMATVLEMFVMMILMEMG